MKRVVAVSGGVDRVVLLDMLAAEGVNIVVAHFDHGIRPDSAADARFVKALAARYGVEYIGKREELGADASEELARERRYAFLHEVAQKHHAKLVTAHHLDDLIETIALNMRRGTRWRGLRAMSDERIERPLLKRTKSELIAYALETRLEWVEDETNLEDRYQRNRVRRLAAPLPEAAKRQLCELWHKQGRLKTEIGKEIKEKHFPIKNRYFMIMIEPEVARELLYECVLRECGVSLLGRQLSDMLYGIRLGRPGTRWQIGQGVEMTVFKRMWSVQVHAKMLE